MLTHVSAIRLRELKHQTRWGSWELNCETLTLFHVNYPHYAIHLDCINSSASMLDWIFQITSKRWAHAKDCADFIEAMRSIYDPQGNLCPFGSDRKIDALSFLKARFQK